MLQRPVRETFELYLRHPHGGPGRFKVVTCPREHVIAHARALLAQARGDRIEVCCGGEHLFTLTDDPGAPRELGR